MKKQSKKKAKKVSKKKASKGKAPVKKAAPKKTGSRLKIVNFKATERQKGTMRAMAKSLTKGVVADYIRLVTTDPRFTKTYPATMKTL